MLTNIKLIKLILYKYIDENSGFVGIWTIVFLPQCQWITLKEMPTSTCTYTHQNTMLTVNVLITVTHGRYDASRPCNWSPPVTVSRAVSLSNTHDISYKFSASGQLGPFSIYGRASSQLMRDDVANILSPPIGAILIWRWHETRPGCLVVFQKTNISWTKIIPLRVGFLFIPNGHIMQ